MTDAKMVPCLPCEFMAELLEFYETLGFTVTYRQKSPNEYAVIRSGACEIHFFGLKGLKAEENDSNCCMIVPEVEALHGRFCDALRRVYGKLPIVGFPKISRFKPGQNRFKVSDPSGNVVRFIKRPAREGSGRGKQSGLAKAIEMAAKLREECGDDESAAKVLDVAIAKYSDAPPLDRVRALSARSELAIALGETKKLKSVQAEMKKIPLSDKDRQKHREELRAADELERVTK